MGLRYYFCLGTSENYFQFMLFLLSENFRFRKVEIFWVFLDFFFFFNTAVIPIQ